MSSLPRSTSRARRAGVSAVPPTARGVATRARIVEAAATLVRVHGVGGTTLDAIMAASLTSRSQLYHSFADKDALMRAVVDLQTGRVIDAHATLLAEAGSMAGLRRWRDAVVAHCRGHGVAGGCPVGALASELADRSEAARLLLAERFDQWTGHLATVLRSSGMLAPGADPDALATATIAALQGGLLLAQTTRSPRPLELALDMALAHVERHVIQQGQGSALDPLKARLENPILK